MSQINHVTVPAPLLEGVVNFIEVASLTTKRAMDEISVHRNVQKKAADLTGPLLDYMLKTKVVPGAQKEAAAAMLGAHDTTLNFFKLAVDKIAEQNAEIIRLQTLTKTAALGVGVDGRPGDGLDGPTTGYNSLTHPIVGGHMPNEMKESDKAFLGMLAR